MVTNQTELTYRVFYPADEAGALPAGVTIIQQYPAFGVVSATPEVAAELRRRYPVEELADPKPPPSVAKVAGVDRAVAENQERAPYIRVIRFALPPDAAWRDEIAAARCQVLDPLGRLTVVVSCSNKASLAKLEKLPNITRISAYVPDVVLSAESVGAEEPRGARANDDIALQMMAGPRDESSARNEIVPGSFIATFFTPEDARRASRSLRRSGIRTIAEAGEASLIINLLTRDDPRQDLQAIATQTGLRSLRNQYVMRLHNNVARGIIAERVADAVAGSLGLTGRGEVVAVADSGLDNGKITTNHPDFHGRIRHIESFPIRKSLNSTYVINPGDNDGAADDISGHGTHVAGSIVGTGAVLVGQPFRGVAPEAELVFQAIGQYVMWQRGSVLKNTRVTRDGLVYCFTLDGIPDDMTDLFQAAHAQGARIHSNSWGGGDPGDYDLQCEQVDQYTWDQRDLLVLFSAGNDGADVNPTGDGIDEGSVTSPGTAKNCLTVGASENNRPKIIETYGERWPDPYKSDLTADSTDDIAAFSSRGPCTTGRRKPDVVAPGTLILSPRSSMLPLDPSHAGTWLQYYMVMNGTSMATPLVAGCAALVRQYLREQRGMASPTAALVKAALIHSAQYMHYRYARPDSKPWADNEQGWGRVSLRHLLNPDPPTQVLFIDHTESVPANDMREFTFRVTDASVPLRVTMVYTDYPGKDLINNLNLVVYAPDNSYRNGNDFAGTGALDALNNVEGVIVESPQVGDWKARVIASNQLQGGSQDFALVLSGGGLQQV